MKNMLNSVKVDQVNSNIFDLTHDVKTSLKFGDLVPILLMECIPGDNVHISAELLLRFMPIIAPVMHRYNATIHYFFCPNRIIWPPWEIFITNGGAYTTIVSAELPAHPYVNLGIADGTPGTLQNYMGIPDIQASTHQVNALPFAAYNKIYNEYYRDENLQPKIQDECLDGDNEGLSDISSAILRKRAWEHDYFTSCLPFAQKGAVVEIPVSQTDLQIKVNTTLPDATVGWAGIGNITNPFNLGVLTGVSDNPASTPGALYADAITGSGTMNDLRTAMRLQEWLEKNARGGTRYTEHLKMHWNVNSSDARLNRPEYITGTKTPVIISEVLNTTGQVDDVGEPLGLPQGNMAGHGIAADGGKMGSFYCEEHGWIMGILSVTPKTAYFQGLHKHWSRFQPTDYAWPSFAHIGEQEVLNKELFADHELPDDVFGYLPRYAEYKVRQSMVTGDMQTTLDYWHSARIFTTAADPVLNANFIQCDPRTDIFAVQDGTDYLIGHILNKIKVNRKLPVFGTPTF